MSIAQAQTVTPTTIGSWVHLSGLHSEVIANRATEAQTYVIRHSLCVDIMKGSVYQTDTCASSIDRVSIDPAGLISDNKEMDLNVVLNDPDAKYYEHSTTMIFNETGNTIFSSADVKPIVLNPAK